MTNLLTAATVAGSREPFAAISWIEGLLFGPLGTAVAVIAVGWLGLSLLSGTLSVRRGGLVLLGCFILFGAPSIARELMGFAGRDGGHFAAPDLPPAVPFPPQARLPSPPDPYAGAALPTAQ